MEHYWNSRFALEGRIWGDAPSVTAIYAASLFKQRGVSKVLVPGAGYGRNTSFFASRGFVVHGIEISCVALDLAKSLDAETTFFKGSVLDMPFSSDTYDAIYCSNVLHLLLAPQRQAFLDRCLKQMADGAVAVFCVFSEKEASYGRGREVEPNTFESKPGRPVHYFTEEDLLSQFRGFRVLETGLMEDAEDHGSEGAHTHVVRYICVEER